MLSEINPQSLYCGSFDPRMFEDWKTLEQEQPSPWIVDKGRILYQSRKFDLKEFQSKEMELRGTDSGGNTVVSAIGASMDGNGFYGPASPNRIERPGS